MIVFRYLARDVMSTLLAITGVLLLIIMSGRFIKYLAQAVNGSLSPEFLFSIISYRIPGFLELILPLGLFLGILLAYGRFYVESEMTVLFACGMSPHRLLAMTMVPAFLVMLLVGALTFWVSPWGSRNVELILAKQDTMTAFDNIMPGRFQDLGGGSRVSYTERLSSNNKKMIEVFIAEQDVGNTPGKDTLLVASSGHQEIRPDGRYLILNDGYRYDGVPGQADFRVTQYQTYGVRLPDNKVVDNVVEEEAMPIEDLWGATQPRQIAELQWRLSILLLVPIVVLIAVPLARVNPRQGRFAKVLPAVILYLFYLAALITVKGALKDGEWSPTIGLWPIHLVFLLIGLFLNFGDPLWRALLARMGRNGQSGGRA